MKLAIDGGTPVRKAPFQPWPIWDEREEQALLRALHSGVWGAGGEETSKFEEEFAAAHDARFAFTVTNGTSALETALHAAGVTYGDEVIVPPYTFYATASACLMRGAIPVFVDIDPDSFNLDPERVEIAITERTRAILPVHIGGCPADMDRLGAIAERHGLKLIEDACQAHGAAWQGKPVGSIGDLGCFSFQSSKNINAGEGGIVITNDEQLADRCWAFRSYGRSPKGEWYEHFEPGTNFRMSQFQAAILRAQLVHMEEWAQRRAENGSYLTEGLRKIGGLVPQAPDAGVTRHAFHVFITRYQPAAYAGWSRDRVIAALAAEGIPAASGYKPLYRTQGIGEWTQKLQQQLGLHGTPSVECPVAEKLCTEAIWLVSQSAFLGSRQDMDDIHTAVDKVCRAAQANPAA
jgi:dTDP-4-amino-4,6-dideoxygalactose transaminase